MEFIDRFLIDFYASKYLSCISLQGGDCEKYERFFKLKKAIAHLSRPMRCIDVASIAGFAAALVGLSLTLEQAVALLAAVFTANRIAKKLIARSRWFLERVKKVAEELVEVEGEARDVAVRIQMEELVRLIS